MAEQNEEKQTKGQTKRLVTRGQYVKVLGKKIALSSMGDFLSMGTVCLGLVSIGMLFLFFVGIAGSVISPSFYQGGIWDHKLYLFVGSLLVLWITARCECTSNRLKQAAKGIELVQPITRYNTGHIPAEESLVRAASIPLQAQEAVLLRPTTTSDETPKEQLLRVGTGNEVRPG